MNNRKKPIIITMLLLVIISSQTLYTTGMSKVLADQCGDAIMSPLPPTNIKITLEKNRPVITWEKPLYNGNSENIFYSIYRSEDNADYTMIRYNLDGFSYCDTKVSPGKMYYYKMTAVNILSESALSEAVSKYVCGDKTSDQNIPTYPQALRAEITDGKPMLYWNRPADFAQHERLEYKVFRKESATEEFALIGNTFNQYFNDKHAQAGMDYTYAVTAKNSFGESELSFEAWISVPEFDIVPPSAVLYPTIELADNKPIIKWKAPEFSGGAENITYKIIRTNDEDQTFVVLTDGFSRQTYHDKMAKEGGTYTYNIVAQNNAGDSDLSESLKICVPVMVVYPPTPPYSLTAELIDAGVGLRWEHSCKSSSTRYLIYRTDSENYPKVICLGSTTEMSFNDHNNMGPRRSGVWLRYVVTEVNVLGESSYSNVVNIQLK